MVVFRSAAYSEVCVHLEVVADSCIPSYTYFAYP